MNENSLYGMLASLSADANAPAPESPAQEDTPTPDKVAWQRKEGGVYTCPYCGSDAIRYPGDGRTQSCLTAYCPVCGKKMDGSTTIGTITFGDFCNLFPDTTSFEIYEDDDAYQEGCDPVICFWSSYDVRWILLPKYVDGLVRLADLSEVETIKVLVQPADK